VHGRASPAGGAQACTGDNDRCTNFPDAAEGHSQLGDSTACGVNPDIAVILAGSRHRFELRTQFHHRERGHLSSPENSLLQPSTQFIGEVQHQVYMLQCFS
jgi:hypothetical protein